MTGEDVGVIPFGEYPDPVVAYAIEGEQLRISATNEAFEERFAALSDGTTLTALFAAFDVVKSTGTEDTVSRIRRGDDVSVYLDDTGELGPFFVRILPPEADTGYVVFADLSGYADITAVNRASSVISHDLRNSLDVAKAHLRAARETSGAEHFEAIATAHDRMERIISDVLAVTRDETVLTPSEAVQVGETARAAWQAVDTDEATLDIGSELPTVTADADRVRRVFENLFRNSVEHGSTDNSTESDDSVGERAAGPTPSEAEGAGATEQTEVTVTVGSLENGFYVADDGVGIAADQREKVTEPGYSTRTNGTGLGLAIVEQIIAAHGWELTVLSSAAGGARFEVRF